MFIEYGIGHRDGTVDIYKTEKEINDSIIRNPGTRVARLIWTIEGRIEPWKDLDYINGLCYADPIYGKANSIPRRELND